MTDSGEENTSEENTCEDQTECGNHLEMYFSEQQGESVTSDSTVNIPSDLVPQSSDDVNTSDQN